MTLTTVMILKNEFKNITELLPLIRLFSDEIVIVDTGSNDGTYSYLEKEKDIILKKIQWRDDFSYARNYSINFASKDFILWLDADDRISEKNIEKIINFKEKADKNKVYFFKIINISDNTISFQLRMFPNDKTIRFKYPVHEQVIFPVEKYTPEFLNIEIEHTGYIDKIKLRKKQLRNLNILNKIENKDYYIYLQIAESYKILKEYIKALTYFKKSLSDSKIIEKNKEIIGYILYEIYKILIILGKEKEAIQYIKIADEYSEFFPLIKYVIGKTYFNEQDYINAIQYFKKFLLLHKSKIYFNPVPVNLENSVLYFIAKSYLALNRFKDAEDILLKLLNIQPDNKSYLDELKKCRLQN